jgi:hypothetical protein
MKMQSITCYTVTDLPYCVLLLFEINKLNLIGIPVNIDFLLFGNEALNCDINCSIFLVPNIQLGFNFLVDLYIKWLLN